jgi:hypothetical protein
MREDPSVKLFVSLVRRRVADGAVLYLNISGAC